MAVDENGDVITPDLPVWWGQAGEYFKKSYTYSDRPLDDDIRAAAKAEVLRRIYYAIQRISEQVGEIDKAAILAGEGNAVNSSYWAERIRDKMTEFSSLSTEIDVALNATDLNNLVSPAWGTVSYVTNMTNSAYATQVTTSDFTRLYSNSYAETDFELYIPGSNTTIPYSAGSGFAAFSIPAIDPTAELRIASTGKIVDTLIFPPETQGGYLNFGDRAVQRWF